MSDDVSLELPRQNVTVVGAFNPAILQPAWVRRWVGEVDQEIAALMPVGGGPPLYKAGELYWVVTTDRLVVHGAPGRAGRFTASVLRTLAHTPLRAAGLNFSFTGKADRKQCGPWGVSASGGVRDLLRGEPADLSLSQVIRRDDGVRLTVKLLWPSAEPDVVLELNYHHDAEIPQDEKRAEELASHVERATEFESDAGRIRETLIHD